MAIDFFDFVHSVRQFAEQALGKHAGKPESGGPTRWVHVAIHSVRIQENHTYTEVIDSLGLMPEVWDVFGLLPEALPDPTALWYPFHSSRFTYSGSSNPSTRVGFSTSRSIVARSSSYVPSS